MTRLLDYYAASDKTDVDSSVAIFRDVFGEDFAAAEADYLASDMANVVGFLDCDAPEVAWSGDTWIYSFNLTCDERTSVGPQQPLDEPQRPILWASVTLTVPAGWFAFDLVSSAPTWISILRCDRPGTVYLWTDEAQNNAYLDSGRYLVFADAYIDTPSGATVTARRLAQAPDLAPLAAAPPIGFLSHLARQGSPHE